MAQIAPRPTLGGYPVGWLREVENTGSVLTGVGAGTYDFNWLTNGSKPTLGAAKDEASSASKIQEPALDNVIFQLDDNPQYRNAITGAVETASGGGTGGIGKLTFVSLSTDPTSDVIPIYGLFNKVLLGCLPHGKSYSAGVAAAMKYYLVLGKIVDDIEVEPVSNGFSKITVVLTGGVAYTSDAGDGSEITGVTMAAIKPAGTDDAGAGIAGPTLSALSEPNIALLLAGSTAIA